MEFVKMYYVVIFTLLTWAVTSSESIDSLTFEGTEPVPVLVGSNVTLKWTYSGQEDQIRIISFNFLDEGNDLEKMARYKFTKKKTETVDLHGYCGSVVWVGNKTGGIAAFRMNNISMLAHGITFAVDIYSGSNITEVNDPQKIFISVPPKVNLKVSETNLTVGEAVTIECEIIQGRPAPTISWYRNGEMIPEETGNKLIINEIQQENAGSYKCKATNNADSSFSNEVMITVHKRSGDQDNGNPESGASSSGLGVGAIVGIVLAILVVTVVLIVAIFCVMKRKGKPTKTVRSSNVNGDDTQEAMVDDPAKKDQVWL